MATRGYHSYNGRGGGEKKKLLAVILVLILLVSIAFLALQHFVVYDDTGAIRVELPFLHHDDAQAESPSPDSAASDASPLPEELTITEPEPAPEPLVTRALQLDTSVLQGGWEAALQNVSERGCNAFALTLKNSDGKLVYPSMVEAAVEAKTSGGSTVVSASLEGLLASGDYYSIARLSALHDSTFSVVHMTEAAVCQLTGYVWYDHYSTHWLQADKDMTRQYIADIAVECADMGFDEILLDEFQFPVKGRINRIDYSAMTVTKTEALDGMADALRAALGDRGVLLSVSVDADLVRNGSNDVSGVVLSDFIERFDRVYVPVSADEIDTLRTLFGDSGDKLVPILSTEGIENGSFLLAP